jgi:acetoin utilization deacetylase AcuC-like enzyme
VKPLGLILDPVFETHDTGPGHPERPARLQAVRQAIALSGLDERMRVVELESAADAVLELAHDVDHVARVEDACHRGDSSIDSMDTAICSESARVARLAAGSVVALCRGVARGELRRGFAAVRPPGHHAERDLAMGFCLFNNVAIAARYLRESEGVGRVMIIDWDVHHGNGTQHIFEADPDVFFFSVHQSPLYPGTGSRSETGRGAGQGGTLNCPLSPGAGDAEFLAKIRDEMVPAADRFRPEFVLISAGFDAHRADPLGGLDVTTEAYAEATRVVCDIADRWAGGRLVSMLEGGYDLDALAESVVVHLDALLATD